MTTLKTCSSGKLLASRADFALVLPFFSSFGRMAFGSLYRRKSRRDVGGMYMRGYDKGLMGKVEWFALNGRLPWLEVDLMEMR